MIEPLSVRGRHPQRSRLSGGANDLACSTNAAFWPYPPSPLTSSTSPPHTTQSTTPRSPPPKSPTENKPSYSSPDKPHPRAIALKADSSKRRPPAPPPSLTRLAKSAPTPARSATYRNLSYPFHPPKRAMHFSPLSLYHIPATVTP